MELKHYAEMLQRRKWVIALTLLVTMAVVSVASRLMSPVYSAVATVRIAQNPDQTNRNFDPNYADRLTNTYVQLLKSQPFLSNAIQRTALKTTPINLARQISVDPVANTELIKVTARSRDPNQAAAIANTLATLLVEQGQKVYSGGGQSPVDLLGSQLKVAEQNLANDLTRQQSLANGNSDPNRAAAIEELNTRISIDRQTYGNLLQQYNQAQLDQSMSANTISIVDPAMTPISPSQPRPLLYLALAALLGLIGGIGLAFLFEGLDPAIHSSDQLETAAGQSLLGWIPAFRTPERPGEDSLVTKGDGQSPAGEAFRVLRSNLLAPDGVGPRKTLLVTSAEPGAGKSTVLANLAVTLAQTGRTVIAVDTDVKRPTLHRIFDVPNDRGLSTILNSPRRLDLALQATKIEGVRLLTSGPALPSGADPLDYAHMGDLIKDLAAEADMVLFDSPPVLASADALILAPMMDEVLVVAAAGEAAASRVQRALQQLQRVGARIVGVVFNKASTSDGDYYYSAAYLKSKQAESAPDATPQLRLGSD